MRQEDFGLRLRRLREERGLTLHQLALQSGLHLSTLSRLENGSRRMHVESFGRLAKGLGVGFQELAILLGMLDPLTERGVLIKSETVLANYHLLNEENLALLRELEMVDLETRNHLTRFIAGLKKEVGPEEESGNILRDS